VRIDTLALQMRPRAPHEAADLGIRLCQFAAGAVFRCYLVVAIPLAAIALSLFEIVPWLPALALWLSKPWLDRSVLFVLSRAAFGQNTTLADLWRARGEVWGRQFLLTWTWRRLSPWRSFTQPVYQLEGLPFFETRRRVHQLKRRYGGAAFVTTHAFLFAELGLALSLMSLTFWLAPPDPNFNMARLFGPESDTARQFISTLSYMGAVLFVEPFYVAAGFGMYLNRRAELEAWDIEQAFRRAFAN
jgi:hypothetical protein